MIKEYRFHLISKSKAIALIIGSLGLLLISMGFIIVPKDTNNRKGAGSIALFQSTSESIIIGEQKNPCNIAFEGIDPKTRQFKVETSSEFIFDYG